MKRLLPLLFLPILTAQAEDTALSAPAAAAAQQMQDTFKPLTRGLRPRGSVATRSGSVIRSRGPVQQLMTPVEAAAADAAGRVDPPAQVPAVPAGQSPAPLAAAPAPPPPPPIPSEQIDQITTVEADFQVNATEMIAFDSIRFELDSATVTPEGQEILRGIAHALKTLPNRRFLVEGHTCDLGTDVHNQRLSCLRAEAACAWLLHFGVSPRQLQPAGFGESDPLFHPNPELSSFENEALRAPNRRVAFHALSD
ncbi:MAG: OmpA family protein [Verrucomicrobiaceae bacterium]|nr:OmpA family protein [Verrucomicrobiaceae bacterium]